ncbi:MAG: hypothetical protein ACI841_004310 [Planctomycetota bacterium]|jgi:hypothetical protein
MNHSSSAPHKLHAHLRSTLTLLLPLVLLTPTQATPLEVPEDIDAVITKAAQHLVTLQENMDSPNKPGVEWPYEGVYRTGGEIPPGYRVGGTSIAAWSLIETPGFDIDSDAGKAVKRGLDFILDETKSNDRLGEGFRGGYDVRGWGQSYALQFLLRLRSKDMVPSAKKTRVKKTIRALIKLLEESAIPQSGGWNYARRGGLGKPVGASPFMTGPTLLALFEAAEQGEKVDAKIVDNALNALEKGLGEDSIVTYNTGRSGRDTQAGSVGRRPISELALIAAGRSDASKLEPALDAFFEHWGELEKRRRQNGTHVAPHGIAPYYFFYAHYYAAQAIEGLPDAKRPAYRTRLLERLFQIREDSGGWNDRVFERSENFGTSMSLLSMLAPQMQPLPTWSSGSDSKSAR